MSMQEVLTLWSYNVGLSLTVWFVIIVLAMYLGRTSAHKMIMHTANAFRGAARLAARSLADLERRLAKRNKDVILEFGREATERTIEHEFHRVNAIVERDLSAYPAAHRRISEAVKKLEEDYQNATETPPSPPAWLEVVNAIGNLPRHGDSSIDQILTEIYELVEKSHKESLDAFSESSLRRLGLLKRMMPSWRTVAKSLDKVKSNIDSLKERATFIDKQMTTYEKIRAGDDAAARSLVSSSLTQFFISALVLVIAVLGGVVNFQLIALPMSEMVGGTSYVGGVRMADVAALVVIMVEIAMGLFLLESLRITHLFPVIHSLDDHMRRKMVVITLTLLIILASVEASLAYMRDLLSLDREALTQALAGVAATNAEFRWIPSVGQMVLGFILPFALAFVAIPLESFVHATRTVVGLFLVGLLRIVAYVARIVGNITYHSGRIVVNAYDFVIFLPLRIEQLVVASRKRAQAEAPKEPSVF